MDWLKNIKINLNARGPAAVLCVYILSLTALGVSEGGKYTGFVVGALVALGPILMGALAQPPDR